MKKKLNITRKLIVIASLFLISCSEDLYEHEAQKNESGYKITNKSFEELTKDKKFMKAYSELSNTGNSTSKTVMEQNYNFTISDIPAKVIEKNGKTSYTFHIVRDTINNNYFENLIVGSDSLNQTTAYIAKYKKDFTKPSLINNVPFTKINVNSIVYNSNPTGKVMECIEKVYSLCNGIPYDCGGSYCGFGSFTLCSGSSGESDNGSGISWGGGGTSTTPISGGSVTNMENFYSSLQLNQQEWLDAQSSQTQQSIFNYLNTNGFTTANKNKIRKLINIAVATNTTFTIDSTVNASNGQVYNNQIDSQNYLNNFSSNLLSNSSDLLNNQTNGNTKITTFRKTINLFTNFDVEVTQNLTPYSITGATSSISGNTFSLSYLQTTPSDQIQKTTVGNITTIVFYGNLNVNVFFEGIGTITTFRYKFVVKANNSNGNPISIDMYQIIN